MEAVELNVIMTESVTSLLVPDTVTRVVPYQRRLAGLLAIKDLTDQVEWVSFFNCVKSIVLSKL